MNDNKLSDYIRDIAHRPHQYVKPNAPSNGLRCIFCDQPEDDMVHHGVDPNLPSGGTLSTAYVLRGMATTFERRNKDYGDNYRMVGPIMRILFPQGVPPELLGSDQFHLLELKIVKLTRFAVSNLTHTDSIHDDGVYSAMIESILLEKKNG